MAFKQRDERAASEGSLGALALLELVCLDSIFVGGLRPMNTAFNLAAWLALVMVYLLSFHRRTPRSELWICGETFCMVRGGVRGRAYRFSQITRVRLVRPLTVGVRSMKNGQPFWQIEVDGACVAGFDPRMQNAQKLLIAHDELRLITQHATGAGAQRESP